MDKLKVFKTISKIFLGFVVFIVLLFGGLILFVESPELFIRDKIAAADWEPKKVEEDLEYNILDRDVEYGYRLVAESAKYMGPGADHPEMRYAGNNLACVNCHLKNGEWYIKDSCID